MYFYLNRIVLCVIAMTVCLGSTILSQTFVADCSNLRFMPYDSVIFLSVQQEEFLIEFTGGKMLVNLKDHSAVTTVNITNKFSKPIVSIQLSEWRLAGGSTDWRQIRLDNELMPNKEIRLGGAACNSIPTVMQRDLAELRLPEDRLTTVVVFGIRAVHFADGSTVRDEKLLGRFEKFANNLNLDK